MPPGQIFHRRGFHTYSLGLHRTFQGQCALHVSLVSQPRYLCAEQPGETQLPIHVSVPASQEQ